MKVGIIGGTGGMGKGFAVRWSKDHNILIGSRDAERANASAQEYSELVKEAYGSINGNITGTDNTTVAKESDILVLSIPYENIDAICSELLPLINDNCVVVSPIVPMTKTDTGFECVAIKEKRRRFKEKIRRSCKS